MGDLGSPRAYRLAVRVPLIVLASLALLLGSVTVAPPALAAPERSVLTLLKKLPVAQESRAGYDRDLFNHWTSTRGCSTREWVLARQAVKGSVEGCVVAGGRWFSYYDRVRTSSSRSLDIDHMVPLAEAWDSGASAWSTGRRERFANDLAYVPALVAVSASSNRSKSDKDPAEWMPPSERASCRYLKEWVGTKYRWGLSVDPVERSAIRSLVRSSCPSKSSRRMTVPVKAR